MQQDPNFNYIIAVYIAAAVLLSVLALCIFISYRRQKKINDETKA